MNDRFRIRFCSDLDYEEMVADICYDNEIVAIISQEEGRKNMKIEVLIPENQKSWDFPLDAFIKVLNEAKNDLITRRKLPDTENL